MKVLFLDIDGVLNSLGYLRRHKEAGVCLDPSRMALLKELTDATEAAVVLTSSWREHWQKGSALDRLFASYGLTVYDKTPALSEGREQEIAAWLKAHPTEQFAILDDRFLSADFLRGHFVRTSNLREGLSPEDVRAAISILGGTL